MQRIDTDRVIIVGAGLGALYAALELAPLPVLILSPDPLGAGASSAMAQGGVSAAMDPKDSAEAHAHDTIKAGAGTVDAAVATGVTAEARRHILDLSELGAPFDRDASGAYVLSREAAHSYARVVRVRGDRAGAEIMQSLVARVRATASIQVLEGVVATGLQVSDGAITGVEVSRCAPDFSSLCRIVGPAILLAGGGSAGLFKLTTNPTRIRGEVIGMAARAGAVIADPEFVQFHPTAIDCGADPAPLITEALRGEGAILVNRLGARFMRDAHPDAELAPRDVVARAVYAQTQAGLRPALNLRGELAKRLSEDFPTVYAACHKLKLDPDRLPIPVAAAAHYHMGGIATDWRGRTSIGGLWACGEAASTGLHGANRLASNGLLEALVFARRSALDIARELDAKTDAAEVVLPDLPHAPPPRLDLIERLRSAMTDGVGVVRNAEGLARALDEISRIEAAQPDSAPIQNMTATATLIARGALAREESRGAHFRADFPEPSGAEAQRTFVTLAGEISPQTCRMETA